MPDTIPFMHATTSSYAEPLKRQLTQEERELVTWLVEHSRIDATRLLPQIDRLSVAGRCTCGCPTVDFALDGVPVERKGEQLISDWLAEVDGEPVGVMLFQTNDRISTLDVYSLAGIETAFGLPRIASIKGY